MQYTQEQLINVAKFSSDDLTQIGNCRQDHNRLGFGYQLAFVRLLNRFPTQVPFELLNDILGWRIKRIWSTDWFKNPQAELSPIIRELKKLKSERLAEDELKLEETDEKIEKEIEQEELDGRTYHTYRPTCT